MARLTNGMNYSNFKTQLCKNWIREGKCSYDGKCSYAHGEHELRGQFDTPTGSVRQHITQRPRQEQPRTADSAPPASASTLRMVLTNPSDQYTCRKILESNGLLQAGRQQAAYEIIQDLLNGQQIYFELHQKLPTAVDFKPPMSQHANSTQATTNQSVTPISGGTPDPFTGRQAFGRGGVVGSGELTPPMHEGGSVSSSDAFVPNGTEKQATGADAGPASIFSSDFLQ